MDGKIKNYIFMGVAFAGLLFCQNCATIFNGTSQKIPVTSTPSGVRVIVDGEARGVTPLVLKLKKKKGQFLRLEKPGYVPVEMRLMRQINLLPSAAGNFFLGGMGAGWLLNLSYSATKDISSEAGYLIIFGSWAATVMVDILTGAAYKLMPDHLILNLTREKKVNSRAMRVKVERSGDTEWIRVVCSESTGAGSEETPPGMNRRKERREK
jgi:hypothetical protein